MTTNEAELLRWNDDRWTRSWPQRERLTSAVTPFLLAALDLRPGERVLDVGCGGGLATIEAARAVEPGAVVGVDISHPLTVLARQRAGAAQLTNISFVVADAQTDRMHGGPFDVLTSQFGVMFFEDPVAAFANLHSHLRPGGRLVFACWTPLDQNPWHTGRALADFVALPRPTASGGTPSGPFSLGDAVGTETLLQHAGFAGTAHVEHHITIRAPATAVFDPSQLEYYGVPEDRRAAALVAVDQHLGGFVDGTDTYAFPLSFLIVSASAG